MEALLSATATKPGFEAQMSRLFSRHVTFQRDT
jgi:hypothetical protein